MVYITKKCKYGGMLDPWQKEKKLAQRGWVVDWRERALNEYNARMFRRYKTREVKRKRRGVILKADSELDEWVSKNHAYIAFHS